MRRMKLLAVEVALGLVVISGAGCERPERRPDGREARAGDEGPSIDVSKEMASERDSMCGERFPDIS